MQLVHCVREQQLQLFPVEAETESPVEAGEGGAEFQRGQKGRIQKELAGSDFGKLFEIVLS